jgi:hypothetical protein
MEEIDRMHSHWYRGAQADETFARFAFYSSDGKMREPAVVGSESARIDPIGRGVVLYVVHEESPE